MNYIKDYREFNNTNESMKTWLTSFLLMSSLGIVPLSVKSQDTQSKKDFVESQPQDKIDAVSFFDYLKKFGNGRPITSVWEEFSEKNNPKSSLEDVSKYVNQDGKNYYFEKDYQEYDFSSVDINQFRPTNWLTDMGNFIPDSREPEINNWISDWERKTSIEIGIITVKSLGDNTIEQYANDQFQRLGVGKKGADNGILLVFSMDDRKSRIETGYGMEEFLPDAICFRILENQIKKNFKSGKYFEGVMESLEEIKRYVGETAYSEKVRWLEEKKKKEEQESREMWSNFIDILMIGSLVSLILGSIGYVVYRGQKSKSLKAEIKNIIDEITEILKKDISLGIKSRYLSKELESLKSILSDVESKASDLRGDRRSRSNNLGKLSEVRDEIKLLREMANRSISKYNSIVSDFKNKVGDINRLDEITNKAISSVERSIQSYNKIKEYGYVPETPPSRKDIDDLLPLAVLAASILLSNVDDAVSKSEEFKRKISSVVRKGENITGHLNSIEEAKSRVKSSDSIIKSKVNSMMNYKSYSMSGELEKINDRISGYKSLLSTSKDWIDLNKKLSALLSEIEDMASKWRGRKEEEEEKIRRKRRMEEEEEERRRSHSSSSGSSSFGGFGGGGSGGGGASSGW